MQVVWIQRRPSPRGQYQLRFPHSCWDDIYRLASKGGAMRLHWGGLAPEWDRGRPFCLQLSARCLLGPLTCDLGWGNSIKSGPGTHLMQRGEFRSRIGLALWNALSSLPSFFSSFSISCSSSACVFPSDFLWNKSNLYNNTSLPTLIIHEAFCQVSND